MHDVMSILPDIIGITGVLLTLIAYFLLNIEKISALSISYALMNSSGSLMILVSLFYKFNLSAFIMEICWLLISLYGFYKAVLAK